MAKPSDMLAAMLARHQIDRAALDAARAYRAASAQARRKIEARVGRQFGGEGLQLIRSVLRAGLTIEAAAVALGETDRDAALFAGALLRRCLAAMVPAS